MMHIVSNIFALVCTLFFVYSLKWLKRSLKNYIILQKLSGPPRQGFIFGNVSYLCESSDVVFKQLREVGRNFYPIYKFFVLHEIGANVLSPEDIELILSNPVHNEKGKFYKALHRWLKSGLLTSNGEKWQTRRKILTPAFHFNILQQFVVVFNEEAQKLVQSVKHDSSVNVTELMSNFSLKIITETAMGTKLEFQTQREQEYKKAIHESGKILLYRILHPWFIEDVFNLFSPHFFRECKLLKTLHNFTRHVIKEKEKKFEEIGLVEDSDRGKKPLAMLDLLFHAKKQRIIDVEGIQEEVDTFMFEGHDTVSAALIFTLMLLANNRNIQERIVEEMQQIIDTEPTYNDLQNLKYMERCIKESLRLYPSVHFITRHLGEDVTTHSGYFLPKGTHVAVHIYDIHHNPDIYPDPEKFDPDRFLPENCQKRHPFAYIPFSAGQRNCIGQKFATLEMKVVLCAILSKFILEPVHAPENVVLLADIVLRSKDDIRVKFVPRS
ncbi:cytochrome P450 4c3-like [Zophobas morio]|uniref:cytochrome P450 4c3-like n=1 Tax=Zophobas morio TaxID=2755281 RepID=UPI0030827D9E